MDGMLKQGNFMPRIDMNSRKKASLIFTCLFLTTSPASFGEMIVDGGLIKIRGNVTAGSCAVDISSQHQIVDMKSIKSSQFKDVGDYSGSVPFTLKLIDCNIAVRSTVGVSFQGVADQIDPQLFAISNGITTAKGIGLALFDNVNKPIIPNARPTTFIPLINGNVELHFSARYRSTIIPVNSGDADAMTMFNLRYQ